MSVPLPPNASLSLGNGHSPRHSRFLNAFTRMAARRGWPKMMLSDNGTNFIAGDREIKELVAQLDQDQIRRSLANKGIDWHRNPREAPHFGGIFEAMIKAAKRAISAILNDANVTDEELQTYFIGVESLLNFILRLFSIFIGKHQT